MTTKVRTQPSIQPDRAWERLRALIDVVLARWEAVLRQARTSVHPRDTVIHIDDATMANVGRAPGRVLVDVPDDELDRLIEADSQAGLI